MMRLRNSIGIVVVAAAYSTCNCDAFATQQRRRQNRSLLADVVRYRHGDGPPRTELPSAAPSEDEASSTTPAHASSKSRREWIAGLSAATVASLSMSGNPPPANAVRAIGGAEVDCRAAGNCLEIGELDGAIGWTWGGKDRCEPSDPRCGPGGKLLDSAPSGAAVPDIMGLEITDIVTFEFGIGTRSDAETAAIRLGLYGRDDPERAGQFLEFVTSGLRTTSSLVFENGMGVESAPVALGRGGIVSQIEPQKRLDVGIPSQANAYARSKGKSKVDDFLAQPRPKAITNGGSARPRDVPGLLTVPARGIGYGGTALEPDDEAYASSFQITSAPFVGKNNNDKDQQRVIGQVIDQESMANLARLVSLPTKKGFKGVIPGQNSGPPLLKVSLTVIEVRSVPRREAEIQQ